jgi:hypothetical protein
MKERIKVKRKVKGKRRKDKGRCCAPRAIRLEGPAGL